MSKNHFILGALLAGVSFIAVAEDERQVEIKAYPMLSECGEATQLKAYPMLSAEGLNTELKAYPVLNEEGEIDTAKHAPWR